MSTVLRSRRLRGALAGAAGLVVLAGGAIAAPSISAAPGNPPGANGTVKIDAAPFDSHPNNQPHVGCSFQVDFYGFDAGPYDAAVDFSVHPPTGRPTTILADQVFVGEDAAGGGTDLDAERAYDLTSALAAYQPHPQQGYHVKLTVAAPGAGGKVATKHKVFWVQGCDTPPPCEPMPSAGVYCPEPTY